MNGSCHPQLGVESRLMRPYMVIIGLGEGMNGSCHPQPPPRERRVRVSNPANHGTSPGMAAAGCLYAAEEGLYRVGGALCLASALLRPGFSAPNPARGIKLGHRVSTPWSPRSRSSGFGAKGLPRQEEVPVLDRADRAEARLRGRTWSLLTPASTPTCRELPPVVVRQV